MTECKSKEVIVEAIGGDDAAHTYKGVGHVAPQDAGQMAAVAQIDVLVQQCKEIVCHTLGH